MPRQRLPLYINRFPDGRLALACAHCSIDAELEGAEVFAVHADEHTTGEAIGWDGPLIAEQFIAAAAVQCMHLSAYRR